MPPKAMVSVCLPLHSGHGVRQDGNTLQHAMLSPAVLREVSGLKFRHDPLSFLSNIVKAH